MSDRINHFRSAVEAAQGSYVECADWAAVVRFAATLTRDDVVVGRQVVVSPGLAAELRAGAIVAEIDWREPEAGRPTSIADAEVGLTRAELGVAETGSVLLVEESLRERVVSMLCHTLVVGVERAEVVESLDEVGAWLAAHHREAPYATLTTGPSRTADIERSLTIGVQGPRSLHVAVVG